MPLAMAILSSRYPLDLPAGSFLGRGAERGPCCGRRVDWGLINMAEPLFGVWGAGANVWEG